MRQGFDISMYRCEGFLVSVLVILSQSVKVVCTVVVTFGINRLDLCLGQDRYQMGCPSGGTFLQAEMFHICQVGYFQCV